MDDYSVDSFKYNKMNYKIKRKCEHAVSPTNKLNGIRTIDLK